MTPTQGLVAEKYTLLGGTSRVLLTLKTNGDEHVLCAPHIAFQIFADTDMINLPSSGLFLVCVANAYANMCEYVRVDGIPYFLERAPTLLLKSCDYIGRKQRITLQRVLKKL